MVRSVYSSTIKPKFDDSRNQLWGLFGSNGLKFSLVIPNVFMPIRRTKYELIVKTNCISLGPIHKTYFIKPN